MVIGFTNTADMLDAGALWAPMWQACWCITGADTPTSVVYYMSANKADIRWSTWVMAYH